MKRTIFDTEHETFRTQVRDFLTSEVVPHNRAWTEAGIVPRELFAKAGAAGLLDTAIPVEYGGRGLRDFRYNQILGEELAAANLAGVGLGLTLHTDICTPYLLNLATPEQAQRWLPGVASGEIITAIGMTEPEIGSDLASMTATAIRDGDHYVVNGHKTLISNGINADLLIVALKTDPQERHKGISLLVLERGMPGLEFGKNLKKVGLKAQDTAEWLFHDVKVPVANLLGQEGQGFKHLMINLPAERLSMGSYGVSAARAALEWTLDHVRERTAFGSPIGTFQNTRFKLAELATEVDVAQSFVDACVQAYDTGDLTAADAAKAKWWCTELQGRALDVAVQLHGGWGYLEEYAVSTAWVDARISRIYGGTTEIMKEVIGRDLGL
ncbi:acyl-CoA dehydrogenase family protein [Arthrobacter sp. NPDC080031]|uniref:acyl-CoA dehydrogenase family protein n=1 Tax=Arthrobacter sp. NPDC080031 TaxID=3155918 RepID=UPI00344EBE90